MSNVIRLNDNTATSVYDDRWLPILQALGKVEVTRASEVEWEDGKWVARLKGTGEIIASGENRGQVVADEVKWLEDRL